MSVVIVTGGTFGLGQAITVELARRGHQVVAFGLAQAQVSSTAQGVASVLEALEQAGCRADVLEADVSNAADVQRVVEHTVARYGAIHGLVNNAAIGPLGTVLTTDEPVFEKILAVNVKGTYLA
ncbi:MAG TPA: SDR family NAD(P)-dependent oxidoreductase, partial [Ramlibacter sp.]|uniref:SDR family NAD(P)-dependent oxidoreductase n=1 Tax=Ramlibacter sp. TaxID=1917967 RepID=UPI002D7EA1F5